MNSTSKPTFKMSVFISHISEEAHIAQVLKMWIKFSSSGKVFVSSDPQAIKAGADWLEKIRSELEDSKVLLILCSPTSIKSFWVKVEAGYGLMDDELSVLSLHYSGLIASDLPKALRQFQSLNMEKEDFSYNLLHALKEYLEDIEELHPTELRKMDKDLFEAIGLSSLGQFRFRSDHPEQEGWKFGTNRNTPKVPSPQFRMVEDSLFGKSLDIDLPEGHFMDHRVKETETKSTYVEFIIKPGRDCVLYTELQIVGHNKPPVDNKWLAVQPGTDEPKPFGQGKVEWDIYVPESPMAGGWIKLGVDLPDQVKKTFGREGWQFDHLKKFRIRGNLSIAEIRMHKP